MNLNQATELEYTDERQENVCLQDLPPLVLKVVRALGLRLHATAADADA